MGRVDSVAGGSFVNVIRGAVSSLHMAETDLGEVEVINRSTLRKFTSSSTFALHNFPTVPAAIPALGLSGDIAVCGMNPAPVTDVSGATQPIRVDPVICVEDDGWSRRLSGSSTFLTMANTKDNREAFYGPCTYQVWFRHHDGEDTSMGFFDWVSAAAGQSFNNLFKLSLIRDGSGNYRVRVEYMTGVNVNHQTNGAVILMNVDPTSPRYEGRIHHLCIVGLVNGGSGFREWQIWFDGVLEETLFPGAIPAEGGEQVDIIRYGVSGSEDGDADFDWPTLDASALSPAEVLEDYDRGKRDCDGSVAPPDIIPPTVDNFDPTPGTPVTGLQTISFDVKDDTGLFCKIMVVFSFDNAPDEFVHDGASFRPLYATDGAGAALLSTVVPIANGFRYTCQRRAGWPSFPTLRAYAIDAGGNEAA